MTGKLTSVTNLRKYIWPGFLVALLFAAGAVTLSFRGVDIFALVAAATSSLTRSPVTLYMTPYDDTQLEIGAAKKIDISINARESINAIGTTITFPGDLVEVLGFSKEKSFFNLWTEDTKISEDNGEIHFSGGTTMSGGLTGTGTVLTIAVRAKKSGHVELKFKNYEVYSGDGTGTKLDSDARALIFDVPEPTRAVATGGSGSPNVSNQNVLQNEKPLSRTPDVNTDGAVNLIDVSIMMMRLVMPYDYHFDLDMDGAITLGDVSIVIANVR